MMHKSHLTAIARKNLPLPVNWLLHNGFLTGHILDYGCGKCAQLNWKLIAGSKCVESVTNYDPYYAPNGLKDGSPSPDGKYDVILCIYVLCALPAKEDYKILKDIQSRLRKGGVAYIVVRNDEPRGGYGVSAKGTFQRQVTLPYLFRLRKTTTYSIYLLSNWDVIPVK